MRHLLTDVRYALRQFARRPGTTLAIVFVLTIGMTVAASLFSFVRSYTTAPAPGITPADDLVLIRGMVSAPEGLYSRRFSREELQAQGAVSSVFAGVAGWAMGTVAIEREGAEETDWIKATFVTPRYFELLGIRPVAGAGLSAASGSGPLVAVISRGLRERHFASDEAALGQTLIVSSRPVTVVGVAPAAFRGVEASEVRGLWLPDTALPALLPKGEEAMFGAFARLRPGVTLAAASEATQAIAANLAREEVTEATREVRRADVVPMATMRGYVEYEREIVPMMTTVSLLGLLVLVVTGTNAGALQTGIAMTRGREIATRVSLGASRRRVLRQLLVESGLLGLIAGAATVGLMLAAERVLVASMANMPFALSFDLASIAFTFGVGLLAGVVAGVSPALFASRGDVVSGLKASGGANSTRRGRLQRGLVVAQILLTQPLIVMLLAMVLLLVGEYQRQSVTESAHEVATVKMLVADVDAAKADVVVETERLSRTLETLPGVVRAIHDPEASYELYGYTADTATPALPFELDAQFVAPGYFETTGLALRAGREFTTTDAQPLDSRQERAVVIGEDLATALWPGESPIGKRLRPSKDSQDVPLLVVGVAHTPAAKARRGGMSYVVHLPAPASPQRVALLVRLRGDTETALREIRAALRQAAPGLGVVELRTLGEVEREVRGQFLKATSIFAGLGVLALLISAIGLYAVVAFAVSQRLAEIAVRLAIGARAGQVVLRMMRDGLRLVTLGLVLGLPASLAGLALVTGTTNMLPPVPLWQVGVLAMLGIATIAGFATWIPARAAARVEPANHLRGD